MKSGVVLLLAVLVMGALALAIGTSIALATVWQTKSRINSTQASGAQDLADACADVALQRIHDNTGYTGTDSVTIGSNSCSFTVTTTGASAKRIEANSTVGETTVRLRVNLTYAGSITISDWTYVDSF